MPGHRAKVKGRKHHRTKVIIKVKANKVNLREHHDQIGLHRKPRNLMARQQQENPDLDEAVAIIVDLEVEDEEKETVKIGRREEPSCRS